MVERWHGEPEVAGSNPATLIRDDKESSLWRYRPTGQDIGFSTQKHEFDSRYRY